MTIKKVLRRWFAPSMYCGLGVSALATAGPATLPTAIDSGIAQGVPQTVIVSFDATAIDAAARDRRAPNAQFDDASSLTYKAKGYAALKQPTRSLVTHSDIDLVADYSHLPMMVLRLRSAAAVRALVARKEVIGIYEDRLLYPVLTQSLPMISQPMVASAGYTGAGTTVVVLDTGVNYTLADFGSCTAPGVPASCKVVVAQDLATADGQLDDSGHGTNVSAIVVGVAPGAKLAVFDVFSGGGAASSTIISGINWAIANQATYNVAAINLSLGDGVKYTAPCSSAASNPFLTPIANANAAGISSVVAAGNNQYLDGISSPACTPSAISVGAVYDSNIGSISYTNLCSDTSTATDQPTCFSNSASFLTLLAPGALITAGGSTQAGTSQASPHVAGAVAVLRARFASDTLSQTLTRLTSSGTPVLDARNNITKPRLNVLQAARPDHDIFSAPLLFSGASGQVTTSNVLASKESGEPNHASNVGGASMWFAWTASESSTCVLSTQGSSFDTLLAVYQGTAVNALTLIASNNNDGGAGGSSSVAFNCTAGQSYLIAVDGFSGATGNIVLTWSLSGPSSADIPLLPPWGIAALLVLLTGLGVTGRRTGAD
ncbi:MAG: S8 family serine peptidase [Gammaproteobacteria bacterium]|nr:S8 family serine peptidase [Gammaproteobacteria bacterium]